MPDDTPITKSELREALDRAVETIATEISASREEASARFADMTREFQAIHTRLDSTVNMLTLLQGTTTTLYTHTDRMDSIRAGKDRATDEAIAEIRKRLDALEKKAS